MRLSLTEFSPTRLSMVVTVKGDTVAMIVDGTRAYMRAGRKVWKQATGKEAVANLLANRWLLVPSSQLDSSGSLQHQLTASYLSRCAVQNPHGTFSLGGHVSVDGEQALVLRDDGDAPGDQPSTIAVALSGRPYPLRITATGNQRPGGSDTCGGSGSESMDGTLTFSSYNAVGKLTIPAHPINLKSLEGQGGGSSEKITPLPGLGPINPR